VEIVFSESAGTRMRQMRFTTSAAIDFINESEAVRVSTLCVPSALFGFLFVVFLMQIYFHTPCL